MQQSKQSEWHEQWSMLQDDALFLFKDWIKPYTLENFSGKTILECGCGGGQHTDLMAQYAHHVTAVDLNTVDIAKTYNKQNDNVTFIEGDIANINLDKQFDVVISIGVVHHTNNPEATISNLRKHVKPGGILIVWVYSQEGNWMVRHLVEPMRKIFLKNISRNKLLLISRIITFFMYPPIYSIYLLPLRFLPYYKYFDNFRKLSFYINVLNVFDKLNAPQTHFINRSQAETFVQGMDSPHISEYKNVSWCISGVKSI